MLSSHLAPRNISTKHFYRGFNEWLVKATRLDVFLISLFWFESTSAAFILKLLI